MGDSAKKGKNKISGKSIDSLTAASRVASRNAARTTAAANHIDNVSEAGIGNKFVTGVKNVVKAAKNYRGDEPLLAALDKIGEASLKAEKLAKEAKVTKAAAKARKAGSSTLNNVDYTSGGAREGYRSSAGGMFTDPHNPLNRPSKRF